MEITPSDQMRLLNEARGLLPQDELEHRARQILDSYTPNQQPAPQTPGSPRLIISDFLRSKGFEPMRKSALRFGFRLAKNYKMKFGATRPSTGRPTSTTRSTGLSWRRRGRRFNRRTRTDGI